MKEKVKEYGGGKAVENSLKAYYKEVKKVGHIVCYCDVFMKLHRLLSLMLIHVCIVKGILLVLNNVGC